MTTILATEEAGDSFAAGERWRTIARRSLVIPLFLLLFLLLLALSPLVFAAAALSDLLHRAPWPRTRCVAYLLLHLACESAGILLSFVLWLGTRDRGELWAARHHRLQRWWARSLYHGAERIFGMTTQVEGDDTLGPGPFLFFFRHVSIGDTVIPAVVLSDRRGLRLRYVLKRELLWDPCLDIVGNRLPNYFVRRGSGESAREIAAVAALTRGLGRGEGVLIYPEGTRFTPGKRERARARLREGRDPRLAALAAELRHVLPPRSGGPLALLEASPQSDAVFCAHTGFEGAGRFQDLWRGSLVHQHIRVQLWRIPAAEIPREREALVAWLRDQWRRMDAWIDAELRTGDPLPAA